MSSEKVRLKSEEGRLVELPLNSGLISNVRWTCEVGLLKQKKVTRQGTWANASYALLNRLCYSCWGLVSPGLLGLIPVNIHLG
jgi:hypothetical protein